MKANFTLFCAFALLFLGCSTGKKALQRGEYDKSVIQAIKRLRSKPGSDKAAESLREAYPLAVNWHLENINRNQQRNDVFRWEKIADEYAKINQLYDELARCPACMSVVGNPLRYTAEANEVSLKAAEIRYELGNKALAKETRFDARQAFDHFERANSLVPGFRDVQTKMNESREMATLRVLVEPIPIHSASLELSNAFFENSIHEFLHNMKKSQFVAFYTAQQLQAEGIERPHHIIRLRFDDFVLGQLLLKEKEIKAKKDSVVVSTVDTPDGPQDVYGTVKATIYLFSKTLISKGLLDMRIIDQERNKVLTQRKFPGEFVWTCEWGHFNGDERAVDQEYLDIVSARELPPPAPQDLFIAFTKPIHDQVTQRIRSFYRTY